jgi:ribosomal protein S8
VTGVQTCALPIDGLMTDREARKAKLGGEVLCYVW